LLILVALGGCTTQLQRPEPPKPVIEERMELQKEAFPKITYRPGRGLTITGDP
jgi:hypothetical protein